MEELFIIKNGERVRLDIGKGGLTIEVQNPLTVSLEEIALSRSWSFTLPDTAANRAAFNFAGVTPRAIRDAVADKYAAEYYADGVPLLPDAVLFLDNIKAGAFVCQLVDNSQAGLARIKDDNKSLRAIIGDQLIQTPYHPDLNIGFSNESLGNSILFDAGVPCVGGAKDGKIFFRNTEREGDTSFYTTAPPPVVPVRWLLHRIFSAYGLTLGVGSSVYSRPSSGVPYPTDDVWTWGVVTLVNTEVTQDQGRARYYKERKNVASTGKLFAGFGASRRDDDMGNYSELCVAINVTIPAPADAENKTFDVYQGSTKVASLQPQYMVRSGGATAWHFAEVVELGRVGGSGDEFSFRYGGSSAYISLQSWEATSSVVFFRYVPNGRTGQKVSLATTLPDVGAWDFIKFLCVQSGSVPYVEGGVFKVRRYVDIGAEFADITAKFNEGTTTEINRAAQGVAQKNYYLMSTEKIDEPSTEYKQRLVCVEADDTTLEPSKETFKAAFASEYVRQGDGGVFTGNTIRAFTAGAGNLVEPQESEPFVGLVCRMPDFEVERFGNDSLLRSQTFWLKCAAIEPDAPWVGVVADYVAKAAGVYKVNLRLSAVDVAKFDPLTAVYIAPLSLVGVVSSIRYTTGREYAEVIILKKQ